MIAFVTDSTFGGEVIRSTKPVVVAFGADWCRHCSKLDAGLQALCAKFSDRVTFLRVDIDRSRSVSAEYDVRSIPTVMLFKAGKTISQCVGALPADVIEQSIVHELLAG